MLFLSNGACGDADSTVSNETWAPVNATNLSYIVNGSYSTFAFGVPLVGRAGPFYRACWAHDPVGLTDYKFEIDAAAELIGPLVRDMECTLGLACSVLLSGYKLSATNKMAVVSDGACGDANATVANETWGIANATNVSANDSMNSSYSFGTPVVGVAGSFYILCWGYDPVTMSDFNVEVPSELKFG